MKASIETREPFLDPDLVALALNLPLEVRAGRAAEGRVAANRSRHLPAAVAEREKVGFGFDYGSFLAQTPVPSSLLTGCFGSFMGFRPIAGGG